MTTTPYRYQSPDEDSARWDGFPFRDGDIVISTRSKSGTTWMQMICALLIFQTPRPPSPLSRLSPWLDSLMAPRDEVVAALEAQGHRRFVKTHTPLDGIPVDERATYIVVARNPLDMAVSLYHQGNNIDREKVRELTGAAEPAEPAKPRPPLREWLLRWIDSDADPRKEMDSLPGVMWHLSDAWRRRGQSNVVLERYEDLRADLDGRMRSLAGRLGIEIPPRWDELVEAAGFAAMKRRTAQLIPGASGVFKDPKAFFRKGTSGGGREVLTDEEFGGYLDRAAALAPADMLAWLHRQAG